MSENRPNKDLPNKDLLSKNLLEPNILHLCRQKMKYSVLSPNIPTEVLIDLSPD